MLYVLWVYTPKRGWLAGRRGTKEALQKFVLEEEKCEESRDELMPAIILPDGDYSFGVVGMDFEFGEM